MESWSPESLALGSETSSQAIPLSVLDAGDSHASLVVVPSIYGAGEDLREQLLPFAYSGVRVAVVDPFWREQGGPLPYTALDAALARGRSFDDADGHADLRAVITAERERHDGPVVTLGICFGGRFALAAAIEGSVDGFACWHGGGLEPLLDGAKDVEVPGSLHFGAEDRIVPLSEVRAVGNAFLGRGDIEIVVHADAGHGFTHVAGAAYHPEGAARAVGGLQWVLRRAGAL